ncbi:hypothetical protein RRG08_055966 [Elysia crispata]|uniref:Uncharacterized protein n=1 Tax=Elysia crispata TaxID=231223 RepID=A0AAE1DZF7_9GAST|nr:hypothetical protein RRG08_055966 [Elysia crispata]
MNFPRKISEENGSSPFRTRLGLYFRWDPTLLPVGTTGDRIRDIAIVSPSLYVLVFLARYEKRSQQAKPKPMQSRSFFVSTFTPQYEKGSGKGRG